MIVLAGRGDKDVVQVLEVDAAKEEKPMPKSITEKLNAIKQLERDFRSIMAGDHHEFSDEWKQSHFRRWVFQLLKYFRYLQDGSVIEKQACSLARRTSTQAG